MASLPWSFDVFGHPYVSDDDACETLSVAAQSVVKAVAAAAIAALIKGLAEGVKVGFKKASAAAKPAS